MWAAGGEFPWDRRNRKSSIRTFHIFICIYIKKENDYSSCRYDDITIAFLKMANAMTWRADVMVLKGLKGFPTTQDTFEYPVLPASRKFSFTAPKLVDGLFRCRVNAEELRETESCADSTVQRLVYTRGKKWWGECQLISVRNMAAQPFIIHLHGAAHQQYRPLTISASHTTPCTATPRPRSNYRERRLALYESQGSYPDFSAPCFYHREFDEEASPVGALWEILGKNEVKIEVGRAKKNI